MSKQVSALVDGLGVHANFNFLSIKVQEGEVEKMRFEGGDARGEDKMTLLFSLSGIISK